MSARMTMTKIYSPALGRTYHPLHLDVVDKIAAYMPISKVKIAIGEWIAKGVDKQEVLIRRLNILLYMSEFFAGPKKVLDLMRACGVVWCKCSHSLVFFLLIN